MGSKCPTAATTRWLSMSTVCAGLYIIDYKYEPTLTSVIEMQRGTTRGGILYMLLMK